MHSRQQQCSETTEILCLMIKSTSLVQKVTHANLAFFLQDRNSHNACKFLLHVVFNSLYTHCMYVARVSTLYPSRDMQSYI